MLDSSLMMEGELLAYLEFMNTFQFPVPPKEYAVASGAIPPPEGAWCYNLCFSTAGTINGHIFVGEIDITKKKCSNKYFTNCIKPHIYS